MLLDEIRGKRIAIFGIGKNFLKKKEFVFEQLNPVICVDNNKELWGKEVCSQIKCDSPDKLNESNIDVVIITPENGYIIKEICTQLKSGFITYTLNQVWDEYEIKRQDGVVFGSDSNKIKHFSCEMGGCVCNIACSYCYVDFLDPKIKYNVEFYHSVAFIVKALSRKRLGGKAYFNMCGEGETLLKPGFIALVRGLLEEGHYVGIITNGTITKKLEELLCFPKELLERLLIQFSCHYLELKRQSKVEVYFNNVNLVRNSGISVCTTIPGADEYIPYKDEIKQICLEKTGFLPVVSSIRKEAKAGEAFPLGSKLQWEEYCALWEDFKSRSIEMRKGTFGRFEQICYAGMSSGWINFETGELRSCCPGKYMDNIYDDITKKISFYESPHFCEEGYCSNNGLFLSGRKNGEIKLPTWYEMFSCTDVHGNSTFNSQIREATNYCCDY